MAIISLLKLLFKQVLILPESFLKVGICNEEKNDILTIILIILFLSTAFILPKIHQTIEAKGKFKPYKSAFERTAQFVDYLHHENDNIESFFYLRFDSDRKIISMDFELEPLSLNENQIQDINTIVQSFRYDFSHIFVTDKRISFGGEGREMYVYSKNGHAPAYFYSPNDGVRFSSEKLGDGWYHCMIKGR